MEPATVNWIIARFTVPSAGTSGPAVSLLQGQTDLFCNESVIFFTRDLYGCEIYQC